MSKTNSIENYVAELHRLLPPTLRNRRQLVEQVSTQLRERADSHLWAALAHGDDISFEEAERHALLGFGPPAKVARSLTKSDSRGAGETEEMGFGRDGRHLRRLCGHGAGRLLCRAYRRR